MIYQNWREEILFLRLVQLGKWMSGNQSRMSTFWKALILQDKRLFWKSLDPETPANIELIFTGPVRISFGSINFSRNYEPWTL